VNAATPAARYSKTIVTRISPVLHKGALGTRMIPTIRSMIVAVLLTVTVLVGGFGLFAAFRVNHEPLARLPVAATPFQLASIDGAPRALNFASDQPRLETTEGLRAVATAMSPLDPDQTDAPAPPPAVPVDDAVHQGAPERVATAPVPDPTATQPPNNPASSPVGTDVATAPPSAAARPETSETPAPAAETPPPEAAVAAASPPLTSQPETITVTGSVTEMPPQQAASPVTAALTTAAELQDTAREIANRKRLATLRRAHRARVAARAQAVNQNSGFGQANFQSASGFQSAQSGIGGPFVSPPSAARRQN
jgi:hypothetical protein